MNSRSFTYPSPDKWVLSGKKYWHGTVPPHVRAFSSMDTIETRRSSRKRSVKRVRISKRSVERKEKLGPLGSIGTTKIFADCHLVNRAETFSVIPAAIPQGNAEMSVRLLVPIRRIAFFGSGIGGRRLLRRHKVSCVLSPPMPKL